MIEHLIEHRLYSIERDNEDKLVLCTPKKATWYALKGYTAFDMHKSLEMEPEYFEEEQFQKIS